MSWWERMKLFRQRIDRKLIFLRGHTGDSLEDTSEIVWIVEAKAVGDLGEVDDSFPDHFFCFCNF